jgi:polyhydroxyalkanoate synthesis regulator phasin
MASTKKTTKKTAKKTGRKKASQSYVVRSIRETRENWAETMNGYHEKYVQKPFEKGKEFFEDLREDPRKVFDDLMDDGKDFVKDVRKDPRKVLNGFVDDGKDFVDGLRKDARTAIDQLVDGGKDFYRGLDKDTRKIFDGLVDDGKNFVDKLPMVKTMEDKISDGFDSIPDRLNLPSKNDMKKLASAMKALNKKVDGLSRELSA